MDFAGGGRLVTVSVTGGFGRFAADLAAALVACSYLAALAAALARALAAFAAALAEPSLFSGLRALSAALRPSLCLASLGGGGL